MKSNIFLSLCLSYLLLINFSCKKHSSEVKLEKEYFGIGVVRGNTGGCVYLIKLISGYNYVREMHDSSSGYIFFDSLITSTKKDTLFYSNVNLKYDDTISIKFRKDFEELGVCLMQDPGSFPNMFITNFHLLK